MCFLDLDAGISSVVCGVMARLCDRTADESACYVYEARLRALPHGDLGSCLIGGRLKRGWGGLVLSWVGDGVGSRGARFFVALL
ncbi:MAG: hypothetical protein ABIQ44_08395 [Chloroflexia bacterium]